MWERYFLYPATLNCPAAAEDEKAQGWQILPRGRTEKMPYKCGLKVMGWRGAQGGWRVSRGGRARTGPETLLFVAEAHASWVFARHYTTS